MKLNKKSTISNHFGFPIYLIDAPHIEISRHIKMLI